MLQRNKNRKRILIFYVSSGLGHKRAAEALQEHFLQYQKEIEVIVIDVLSIINSFIVKSLPDLNILPRLLASANLIDNSVFYKARLRSKLFRSTDYFNKIFIESGKKDVLDFISNINPNVIVSTNYFPLSVISQLKEEKKIKIPSFAITTDYVAHAYWSNLGVDEYFVTNDEYEQQLRVLGVTTKITVTGIPIKSNITNLPPKNNVNNEILIILGNVELSIVSPGLERKGIEFIKLFIKYPSPYTLHIICGNNDILQAKIKRISNNHPRLHIYGFLEDIGKLYSRCDYIITKPGGLTCTEGIATDTPLLFIAAPGPQEKDNANYLEEKGVAKYYKKPKHLFNDLSKLLEIQTLNEMRSRCRQIKNPKATYEIVKKILTYL